MRTGSNASARAVLARYGMRFMVVDFPAMRAADVRRGVVEAIALVLTVRADPESTAVALKTGAAEVLHKSAEVPEIVEAERRLNMSSRRLGPISDPSKGPRYEGSSAA